MPLHALSASWFSVYATMRYISAIFHGSASNRSSASIACFAESRARYVKRNALRTLVLFGSEFRRSASFRSVNVSPERYSSASRPPSSRKLSLPLVARLSRAIAPTRIASAPLALLMSPGLMTSGSVTSRISSATEHPPSARTPTAGDSRLRHFISISSRCGDG
jgi:hypothetical protein